jgi:hypothetical protein
MTVEQLRPFLKQFELFWWSARAHCAYQMFLTSATSSSTFAWSTRRRTLRCPSFWCKTSWGILACNSGRSSPDARYSLASLSSPAASMVEALWRCLPKLLRPCVECCQSRRRCPPGFQGYHVIMCQGMRGLDATWRKCRDMFVPKDVHSIHTAT